MDLEADPSPGFLGTVFMLDRKHSPLWNDRRHQGLQTTRLLEQEPLVVLRGPGGDCHVPRYLGHIFQGLLGQLAVLDLVTVFAGQRHEGVSLPQLLLLFFLNSWVKGGVWFGQSTWGQFFFCVCAPKYFYFPSRFLNLLFTVSVPPLTPPSNFLLSGLVVLFNFVPNPLYYLTVFRFHACPLKPSAFLSFVGYDRNNAEREVDRAVVGAVFQPRICKWILR